MKTGIRTGTLYLNMNPKKLGIRMLDCSAMDLTMKLGPLPI